MQNKILIIEDEQNITRLLKVNLASARYIVDNACDGIEGLDKIKTFSPDLIVLDLRMPKLNGLEILKIIKANPEFKSIKIIILTASDKKENRTAAISMGADAFLSKPVDLQLFIEKVNCLLKT
ncbi:MAG: hypothetical protein A2252_03800 [Elusimicrobia bacterium RIFOXYA2_FULL_39_19]|nr:MAG: hypothetical protein A2252_03800 [Elusimicrobia bacterium RIFOXYA2_FULL_39_19]